MTLDSIESLLHNARQVNTSSTLGYRHLMSISMETESPTTEPEPDSRPADPADPDPARPADPTPDENAPHEPMDPVNPGAPDPVT